MKKLYIKVACDIVVKGRNEVFCGAKCRYLSGVCFARCNLFDRDLEGVKEIGWFRCEKCVESPVL